MNNKIKYKVVIPARANSKRLPGKNMKFLGNKPLIQYSIDYALSNFEANEIWVNSDDNDIITFAISKGVNTLVRPDVLGLDLTSTVDVLKFQVNYFKNENIECDAIILLQATNPFRNKELLKSAIVKFESSKRNSLASFSIHEKKIGEIKNNIFKPTNYLPGQRSQDLKKSYFENGLIYITKCESILLGKIITKDVYPLVCNGIESTVDIDHPEDFIFAEYLLKLKSNNHEK
jgi:CMP-N-acetylneuraminic acid synthetase